MALQVYNSLSRKIEPFQPLKDKEVKLYTCGPTVYNHAHIGNLRSFTFYDIFKRYLIHKGFKVNHVMNITDVEDKIIRDSQKAKKPLKEFTEYYTKLFFDDLEAIGILPASSYPKATDYIKEMADFIQALLDNGSAYKSEDGVYFAVHKFKDYGKLSHTDLSHLKAGASGRVKSDEYEKATAADFVLWKAYDKKDGDVFWETSLGKGRPGWHIECSVMATKLLGPSFDVHMGGIDLIFPHHENEIAQSEACTKKPFAKYWIHSEHLMVDGKKMSKSLGNFFTLPDLLKRNLSPMAIRYALLSVHYRQKMNFTIEAVHAAENALEKIRALILSLDDASAKEDNPHIHEAVALFEKQFDEAMDNDLEISQALAALFHFVHEVNKLDHLSKGDAEVIKLSLKKINQVLGVLDFSKETIPKELVDLANQREAARKAKDFKESDVLRQKIESRGYLIEDTPHGPKLRKK